MSVSFAATYEQFVSELMETFPEYKTQLTAAKTAPNARENFLAVWKTHTNNIAVQNSNIFTETGLELVPGFAMTAKLWSELSNNSRNAIWRYLTSLLLIAAAFDGSKTEGGIWDISGFEHDMEEMMKRLKSGEDNGMKDIFEKLSKMMEGFGLNDGSNPFGSGAGDAKFKIPERLFKGHIAKIAEEIVSEFNPEDFGLSPELLNSNDPTKIFTFMQEIFTQKPDLLISIAQRIAKKIQAKFQRGDFNRDDIIREAEELMKEFSDNEAFSGLFEQLGEMLKGGEKESGNEGSARRREVQERLKKKAAEKAAKKAAGGPGGPGGPGVSAAAVAAADAAANMLLMEEDAINKKKTNKK
jgi:hypothetical protein